MTTKIFHPVVHQWFVKKFGEPTDPQRQGWPHIAAGRNTLIAAPTGSGKTLAAFLVCIDRLFRQWADGQLPSGTQVVYVSPLKALSNDIHRNLEVPLAEIREEAMAAGYQRLPLRAMVRTGDTPAGERQAMLRNPPHILVTTPESLYLLLTAERSRAILGGVQTVIVDEIHALARDKRGSHLSLSLERLAALTEMPPVRIGLSATQRPIDEIARFLVGNPARSSELVRQTRGQVRNYKPPARSGELVRSSAEHVSHDQPLARSGELVRSSAEQVPHDKPLARSGELVRSSAEQVPHGQPLARSGELVRSSAEQVPHGQPADSQTDLPSPNLSQGERDFIFVDCQIVDVGHARDLDLALEVPPSELSAVCSHEQWGEVYERLLQLIAEHRSTLIFVNTRRLAERVAHHLTELLGEDAVASHHGSLSRQIRLSAEQRLKSGQLKAIVATASLELGIDVGFIDLVCQIGSPRSIATFLQRIGRSGHCLHATPKGRLFPLTRDELLECMALIRAVRGGDLDRIEIPHGPLDILAQQIVAAVACEEWGEDELFHLVRRAWPYRNLSRENFNEVVRIASEGIAPGNRRGAYLHRDGVNKQLSARRSARLTALTCGGAIPETAEYRVVTEQDGTFVGKVDEDFAIESLAGDIFLLGNTSWQVRYVRGGEVVVQDAHGAPPNIPFWFGEAPGRTMELSAEVSKLRQDIAKVAGTLRVPSAESSPNSTTADGTRSVPATFADWLETECGAPPWAAEQACHYVEAQQAALGLVPTQQQIVFERFFDESGGMQLVIHAPLGARINRAWGLALRKRFCRSFDFELQASADDNGIVLSLGPQHSFAIDSLFKMLTTQNAEHLLTQALLAAPMFQVRWRWNVTRALAVLRQQKGQKVPPHLQRYRSDDLLAAVFPQTVGCLENHHGDVPIPDHAYVRQTVDDCLREAMDIDRWLQVLGDVEDGRIALVPRDTREPSPFAYELLNANPYAFLDGAPLEERRTRAIATRRSLPIEEMRDLARLDERAIQQVCREAWPLVRDVNELHDALLSLVALPETDGKPWQGWFEQLVAAGRAARATVADGKTFWVAAERVHIVTAAFEHAVLQPNLNLPDDLQQTIERNAAWVELVRGHIQFCGPTTAPHLAARLHLETAQAAAALESLEGDGTVLRGNFLPLPKRKGTDNALPLPLGEGRGEGNGRSPANTPAPNASIEPPHPNPLPEGEGTERPRSNSEEAIQWCDRRLLARIHRLTLLGLRKQIQPAEPADYVRFLIDLHGVANKPELGGPGMVREAIVRLEGFQLPAGAWEHAVLPTRITDFDPAWLDQLFLSGDCVWGRLRGPKTNGEAGGGVGLTRAVPMTVMLRKNLPWLLPAGRETFPPAKERTSSQLQAAADEAATGVGMSGKAQLVLQALQQHGALFVQEIDAGTELLPVEVEDALRELAALGLVTSDAFAAVRAIVGGRSGNQTPGYGGGRWSLFPGLLKSPPLDVCLDHWCRKLLTRYGVVFRDVLARESAAPPWHQLVPVLRTLERRGEIRGGRFIRGVSGEQFATEHAVKELRRLRDAGGDESWVVLSAADPLNLSGIVDDGPRIAALQTNTLILSGGRCVAARIAGKTEFFADLPAETSAEMSRALLRGSRGPSRSGQTRSRRPPRLKQRPLFGRAPRPWQ